MTLMALCDFCPSFDASSVLRACLSSLRIFGEQSRSSVGQDSMQTYAWHDLALSITPVSS